MKRLGTGVFLAAIIGLGWPLLASAQPVEFSDNVFHVRACSAPAMPGQARCHAHIVSDGLGRFVVRNAASTGTPSGYGPSQLRAAYNFGATGSSSTLIAIVDAYGYTNAAADLAVYRAKFGLPACTIANGCLTIYNESGQKGNLPAQNVGWAQEQALDLDMASAACPNCRIALIQASSNSYSDLAVAENLAARLGARAISNSYGGGEMGTQFFESAYNHAGVAITASTGDNGYGAGPQFPATSPHVIAVGGTKLSPTTANPRGWVETAWGGGGSGCSAVYGKPVWQTNPLCTMRMEADISVVGAPGTGVAVYGPTSATASAWLVFGGTSVGAPLIAGMYAAKGVSVNYGSSIYSSAAVLNDVTSGSNGSCGGTYFCNAVVGYDGPTGRGSPNGSSAFSTPSAPVISISSAGSGTRTAN